jgi:hypothetical protein
MSMDCSFNVSSLYIHGLFQIIHNIVTSMTMTICKAITMPRRYHIEFIRDNSFWQNIRSEKGEIYVSLMKHVLQAIAILY